LASRAVGTGSFCAAGSAHLPYPITVGFPMVLIIIKTPWYFDERHTCAKRTPLPDIQATCVGWSLSKQSRSRDTENSLGISMNFSD
jgi:hypothetical protein